MTFGRQPAVGEPAWAQLLGKQIEFLARESGAHSAAIAHDAANDALRRLASEDPGFTVDYDA